MALIPGAHARQTAAKGVHQPYRWSFANAAARVAFVPDDGAPDDAADLIAADLHCSALQLDDGSVWRLSSISPVTWAVLTGATGVSGTARAPSVDDKGLPALATAADGDPAIASGVTTQPVPGSYVGVLVNGNQESVGDGTKVGCACYFSADGGATARAFADVAPGDVLYWNGSIAGYELATTDRIDIDYDEE